MNNALPILGFCAASSGMGKTTLLTKLIPELAKLGIRTSIIKHAHHNFDIDKPGKDSYRLREAGAVQTLVASSQRWALMTELSRTEKYAAHEPDLPELITNIDMSLVDLILVEGFKYAHIAKIEIHRPSLNMPLLANTDQDIIAIACDDAIHTPLPILDLNDPPIVAGFIQHWLKDTSNAEN
ncbi:MAG: molybdopterin-guanine dinucleotide biosynthesis protein B [Methylophilaceae bacterium]